MTKRYLSLRTAVILPFTLVLIATISIITVVQKITNENMLQEISQKQLTNISQNISSNLTGFLLAPFKVSIAVSDAIAYNNIYDPNNSSQLTDFMRFTYLSLESHMPQLDALSFGGEIDGQYIGMRREKGHHFSLMKKDNNTDGYLLLYKGETEASGIRGKIPHYAPQIRPWYAPVAKSRKPMWSEPYTNNDERQEITLSAQTPVLKDKQLIGVLTADIKLTTFDRFLAEQKKQNNASVFIFDQNKRLIAHSDTNNPILSSNEPKTSRNNPLSITGSRISITESVDPIIRKTAQKIIGLTDAEIDNHAFSFILGSERYFSYLTPYTDEHGLTWYISVTLPESELLGELPYQQQQALLFGLLACLFTAGIGFVVFNRITSPIKKTANAARELALGHWSTRIPDNGFIRETSMLVKSFNDMAQNLRISFSELRKQLIYDSLTQLYSRQGLIEECSHNNISAQGMLVVIGVEKFRAINDSLGHVRGDQVLVIISERLKSLLPDNYLLARVSGDEFAIYAPELSSSEQADKFITQIKQQFVSPIKIHSELVLINAVIGSTQVIADDGIENSLRNASIALSYAKKEPIRYSAYLPEMADVSLKRTQTIALITQAIKNDEFIPFYQPLVDLQTKKIIGAEALARWLSPTKGIIPPNDFISIAEEYGLIHQIGHQILLKSCIDTQQAIESGHWDKEFHLHVNVSVTQLLLPSFIDSLQSILKESKIAAHNLTLEVTESNIVSNDVVIKENLRAICALGISIAIDDFGTGYSSLAYLQKMDFDCLKIDRSFTNTLTADNADSSIVAAILTITKELDIVVLSEGVETEEQAKILTDLGCQQAQGYLYGRPVPLEQWPDNIDVSHLS
ncbi:bifunctional diguanylate cyclase/phosphodiesterase [Vibrio algicola]|uniref:EAL domain-containing protein n=1 Tax=Vibrio algicola TaxID=2662262 RepID=A0A5Q0TI41_9VIBR|nr:EAL domain-containing protein [Vibrio algicola]